MSEKKEIGLAEILKSHAKELMAIAPKYVNVQRMMALALEATIRNPLLAKCSGASVINFCLKCAETGTDRVGSGGMWPVPFYNSKTGAFDMVPIPDWRLLIEKARRAKVIKHAAAEAVYEEDVFEYEKGLEPKLIHKPAKKDRGELVAVYCVYTLPDGEKDFVVMSWKDDIQPIRDRTNAWKAWIKDKRSNPWVTDPAEQAKKTVVKRALKVFEGASPELTKLIDTDNAVLGFPALDFGEPIAEPKELPSVRPGPPIPDEIPPPPADRSEPEPEEKTAGITPVQIQQIIALRQALTMPEEDKDEFMGVLQAQAGIAEDKKPKDFTQQEAKDLVKLLKERVVDLATAPKVKKTKEEKSADADTVPCVDCDTPIKKTHKSYAYSMDRWNEPVCFICGRKRNK